MMQEPRENLTQFTLKHHHMFHINCSNVFLFLSTTNELGGLKRNKHDGACLDGTRQLKDFDEKIKPLSHLVFAILFFFFRRRDINALVNHEFR